MGRRRPYYAQAVRRMEIVNTPGLGPFAVDRWWQLYIDPAVVEEWSAPQISVVLKHEVGHLLRDHEARGERLGAQGAHAWNVACDLAINDDLCREDLPGGLHPSDLDLPEGLLEEQYHARLPATDHNSDCGSGAHGEHRSWGLVPSKGVNDAEAAEIRSRTAERVLADPDVSSSSRRWAERQLGPRDLNGTDRVLQAIRSLGLESSFTKLWARPPRRSTPHILRPAHVAPHFRFW